MLALPAITHADPAAPPAILPSHVAELGLGFELDSSSDRVARPLSIAPDASYGVTSDVTLAIEHSSYATTGFRGAAGRGFCLASEGCKSIYNNVGAEALYAVARGELAITADGGVLATDLDAGFYAIKAGLKARLAEARVAVTLSPSTFLAISHRDDMKPNRDAFYFPVLATYKATDHLVIGATTGVKGPLEGLARSYEVSVGALAIYTLDANLAIGTSFVFGKIAGGANDPPDPMPPATGARYRVVQAWINYRM